MASHNDLGILGESIAAEYLKGKGYRILETNWVCGHKEIDIIAMDGKVLVIVEVKTRQIAFMTEPAVTVGGYKQQHLIWAAERYVIYKRFDGDTRFDIVSIIIDKDKQRIIRHIENAFYPKSKFY